MSDWRPVAIGEGAAGSAQAGVGASERINLSCLSSAQKSAGIGWRKADSFCFTCAREIAPGMIEATIEGLVRFRFREATSG